MNNKVIVKLIVPQIDKQYELYLPINKKIGNIIELLINEISSDIKSIEINPLTGELYNIETKERYNNDVLLANSSIKNGSILILLV